MTTALEREVTRLRIIVEGLLDAGGGTGLFPTRSELTALTVDADVDAIRTAGYASVGDWGGGLYKRASVEPSHQGKVQSGDGAWWELAETVVTLEMFGGKGDAVFINASGTQFQTPGSLTSGTNNHPAFVDALAYLDALVNSEIVSPPASRSGSGVLQIGYGDYYVSQTVNVSHRTTIRGYGSSGQGSTGYATQIVFPVDTTGFYIISTGTPQPAGWLIERLWITSLGGTDRTKHGVRYGGRGDLRDCRVRNFAGNGMNVVSSDGNMNFWRATNSLFTGCHSGAFVSGGNTNGGSCINCNFEDNRAWGFWDSSFLGSDWVACGAQSNGTMSQCSFGGNRYYAMTDTLATLQATEPGTNSAVWAFSAVGGVTVRFREWTAGNTLEWTRGGVCALDDNSSRSGLFGGYLGEADQPPILLKDSNCSFGGLRAAGFTSDSNGPIIDKNGIRWSDIDSTNYIVATGDNATMGVVCNDNAVESPLYAMNENGAVASYAQVVSYHGYKVDGTTKRPAGAFYGKKTSSDLDLNSEVGLRYWQGAGDAYALAVGFNGQAKTAVTETDNIWSFGTALLRWASGFYTKLFFGAGATYLTSGTGTPEGVVTAPIGALFTRSDGGASTTLYVKESGAGNTGWVAK